MITAGGKARALLSQAFSLLLLLSTGSSSVAFAQPTLNDLWAGRAHFEQVSEIKFGEDKPGVPSETATWYAVKDGRWFAFSRVIVIPPPPACPSEHRRVVVRESLDKGRTWSPPVLAVEPGMSTKGDGCAVLDGSSYYDRDTRAWHLVAQCLDRAEVGGWGLCHYTRRSSTPMGRFVPDPANPVVRGGQLWREICREAKSCPPGVIDEGTPDIVGKRDGVFTVTIHGYEPKSGRGYRGVIATPDFHSWRIAGADLPQGPTLSRLDCKSWFPGCIGFGEASSLVSQGRIYTLVETMDRGLACQQDQQWYFALLRSRTLSWPTSGRGDWEFSPGTPLLKRSWPDPRTPCALAYAHFLRDANALYLTYEDWEAHYGRIHRRLLKLVKGGGPVVQIPKEARGGPSDIRIAHVISSKGRKQVRVKG
jgi:hypothetical protein